jgi:hypothetical protein
MSKFEAKSKYVTVKVTIKGNVLVDDYKVQQYIDELNEQITNHVIKGLV